MGFANHYFERFGVSGTLLSAPVAITPDIIVVIPVCDELGLPDCLDSLASCTGHSSKILVIFVVNHGIHASDAVKNQNAETYRYIEECKNSMCREDFAIHELMLGNVAQKTAGVGFARKTGMDEAIRVFNMLNKSDGIIASLDADCKIETNYFSALEEFFKKNSNSGAAVIRFAHPLSGNEYPPEIYDSVCLYELYLRYFKHALSYIGYPFPIYTIGSCFAVNAESYIRAGGMNKRQGGEDFYFLHKLTAFANVGDISGTCVQPSPRISMRVPFGTGPAIQKILNTGEWKVYNFALFEQLKHFFAIFDSFYYIDGNAVYEKVDSINQQLGDFCRSIDMAAKIQSIKLNTASLVSFEKKMFQLWNVFTIIKYLNSQSQGQFPLQKTENAVYELLTALKSSAKGNNPKDLLEIFRAIDK